MAAVTTLNGVKMISLSYRANTCNSKKIKDKKYNFLRFFGNRLCHHTIRYPSREKQHDLDRKRAPSNFINRCKFVEEYYDCMPASYIVNRNA